MSRAAQSQGSALYDPNFFTPQEGANGPVFVDNTGAISQGSASQGTSSGSMLDTITVTASAINTVIGNAAGAVEQGAELALLNARGWGVNQYVRTFGMRNAAHVAGKGSIYTTVALDVFNPNVTALATGRDASAAFVGFYGGPPGAIGAGTYFTIDTFYKGGIESYGADYLSVDWACAETGGCAH